MFGNKLFLLVCVIFVQCVYSQSADLLATSANSEPEVPLVAPSGNNDMVLGFSKNRDWSGLVNFLEEKKANGYPVPGNMIDETVTPEGATSLILAIHAVRYDAVKSLLEAGANVNVIDHRAKDYRPLHHAVSSQNCNAEIVKLLLRQPGIEVNATENWGDTPAMVAANQGVSCVDAANALIRDRRVDFCARTRMGTPKKRVLDFAKDSLERFGDNSSGDWVKLVSYIEAQTSGCGK